MKHYVRVSNKLKLKLLHAEKEKSRFALSSDISLLIIAVLLIYGVIETLLSKEQFTQNDFISLAITCCIWVMIKGKL